MSIWSTGSFIDLHKTKQPPKNASHRHHCPIACWRTCDAGFGPTRSHRILLSSTAPARNLPGAKPRFGRGSDRCLRREIPGETPQGGRMPDQGSRSTAGLFQLPCRALGSLADDEPNRKRIRNGPAQDSADERFVVVNDRQADGVQAGHRRIKNLATAKRHKSLAEDCRRCQIQRRHRGPRSAGKPRRLIAPRHLKSLIAPLSLPLHPSRRHLEPPPRCSRRRRDCVPLEGLSR
jgi:hypothetical protein